MLNRSLFTSVLFFFGIATFGFSAPLAILQENCVNCHSPSKRKGGLLIDSRESLISGGESGESIIPGEAKSSYLIETLFADADPHMPPKSQLKPKEIAELEKWINQGAKWDDKLWKKLTRPERAELTLSAFPELYKPVLAIALSPDGKSLAAGRGNGIDLYQITETKDKKKPVTLTFKNTLTRHSDQVQAVAFSPDGKTLVSGGFQKLIIQNHTGEGKPTVIEKPFYGRLTALAFSPDGKTLLIADSLPSQIAHLHVFDPIKNKVIKTIESAHNDSIYDLTFHPDGKLVASASADKMAIIRETKNYKITTKLEGHTGYVLSVAFAPDTSFIATAGDDEAIKIWETKTGTQTTSFTSKNSGPVGGLFWTLDPDNVAKKKKDKKVNTDRIVSINDSGRPGTFTELKTHEGGERSTGAKERRHDRVDSPLTAMAYDAKKLLLFAGSEDGRLFIWDKMGKKFLEVNEPVKLAKISK